MKKFIRLLSSIMLINIFILFVFLPLTSSFAMPIVLYSKDNQPKGYWEGGENWPFDIGAIDDSELLYLEITGYF